MDPVTIFMGVSALAGMATQIFGADKTQSAQHQAADISSQIYQTQGQIYGVEQQENYMRYQQMLYGANRTNLENLRRVQQAQASSVSEAANSGGLYGSSLQAARGADVARGAFNTAGISMGIQFGTQSYGFEQQVSGLQQIESQQQSRLATAQGNIAAGQGIQQMGASIVAGSQPFGKLAGNLFS